MNASFQSAVEMLDGEIERLTEEIAAIKAVRRMLAEIAKRRGAPAGKQPTKRKARREPGEPPKQTLTERIFDTIKIDGPGKVAEIAERLGVSPQAVGAAAGRSDWFIRDASGLIRIAVVRGDQPE